MMLSYPLNVPLVVSACLCLPLLLGLVMEGRKSKRMHGGINLHVALVLIASLLAIPLARSLPESDSMLVFLLAIGLAVAPLLFSILTATALAGQMLREKSPVYALATTASIVAVLIQVTQIRINMG